MVISPVLLHNQAVAISGQGAEDNGNNK